MNNIEWEFYRGDTCEKLINIYGWNKDKDIVLQKTIGNGIAKTEEDEEKKTYLLVINATDTDDLLTDYGYVFDIEIVSGYVKRTIVKGTITLTSDITQTINEVTV